MYAAFETKTLSNPTARAATDAPIVHRIDACEVEDFNTIITLVTRRMAHQGVM
jgi:hypothetical protein